jgi:tRNA wybutosine-synthesizing protein 2
MNHETSDQETAEFSARVVFVVPKSHVKTVKSALERTTQLDRSSKILPEPVENATKLAVTGEHSLRQDDIAPIPGVAATQTSSTQDKTWLPRLEHEPVNGEKVESFRRDVFCPIQAGVSQQRMRIPTTITYPPDIGGTNGHATEESGRKFKSAILRDLDLGHLFSEIALAHDTVAACSSKPPTSKSPMHKALREALSILQESVLADMNLSPEVLVSAFPDGYSIYKPMLLFPHNAFTSQQWRKLLSRYSMNSELLAPVWQHTAASVGATHVAINSPIPLETDSTLDTDLGTNRNQENILRRPVNLVPIYGDFGSSPTLRTISSPTAIDFESALWVTTKQNGIWQVWAPLYTMFSRGNIREKTRILNLPSVTTDLDVASAAVDLYAGIGYFAFSYKKSGEGRNEGIQRVMCWELNPWSVEGLRRGAEKNGWVCKIMKGDELSQLRRSSAEVCDGFTSPSQSATEIQKADFWVFQASNEGAESDYASMCTSLGLDCKLPIRHVNLGLLPSSRLSWSVAVGMLDEQRGGWIHVHENIGIRDIDSKSREIEGEIDKLVDHRKNRRDKTAVRIEHVEWVKMYAPGVVHCVLDVHIQGVL